MKTGNLILIGCVLLLAVIAGASATTVTVKPKTIDSGDTITMVVQGMPNGAKFNVIAKGAFHVANGESFNFITENITIPILGGTGSFTVKNKNTTTNNIVVGEYENPEELDETPYHEIAFTDPSVGGEMTATHSFDNMEGGVVTVKWGGSALGPTENIFKINSKKISGPKSFEIPITVTTDHVGKVTLTLKQNGNAIYKGEVTVNNPTQFGAINITSKPSNALVYLDGVYQGLTPQEITGIPAGVHKVKVSKSGYYPITRYITIPENEMIYSHFKLTRK